MTPAQEGAYIRLLAIAWEEDDCGLPDDDEILAVLSRLGKGWFKGGSVAIRKCFFEKNGKLYNKRLLIERKKQREWRTKSSEGGKKSAKLRQDKKKEQVKGGSRVVDKCLVPNGNSPSPSPSPNINKKKKYTKKEIENHFAEFYKLYPKHTGKDKAYQKYLVRLNNGVNPEEILSGLEAQLKAKSFDFRENKKYVMHPATWLHGGHWEDEVFIPDTKTVKEEPKSQTCFSCDKNKYVDDDEEEQEVPKCSVKGHRITLENMNKAIGCDGYGRRKEEK